MRWDLAAKDSGIPRAPSVLLIEDDETIADLVTTDLQRRGCLVRWAEEGETGLWLAQAHRPDVVLLDLAMPILDGFGFLEARRRRATIKDIPVIVMTARHDADDVRRAIALGASDYVAKPFALGRLATRISRLLPKGVDFPDRLAGSTPAGAGV